MKTRLFLSLGILSCLASPVQAAGDVDLLSFDPVPQRRISDSPPLEVVSPQIKTTTAIPIKPDLPLESAGNAPASPTPRVRPQPPVEVTPKKSPRPVVKAAKPAPAKKPVKPAAKPEQALPDSLPKTAPSATPPALPAVRPVLKITSPAEVKEGAVPQVKSGKLEMVGPKEIVVPPPSLNPQVAPVPSTELEHSVAPEKRHDVQPPPAPESFVKIKETVIARGDALRIEVAGENDLSGWYKVSNEGAVTFPLIGTVRAEGFTPARLAEILSATLKDGYLVNPHVTVTARAVP